MASFIKKPGWQGGKITMHGIYGFMTMISDNSIKLLIVEENVLIQRGMMAFFKKNPHVHLVGQVGNGQGALEMMSFCQPDVITLDFTLPDMDGLTLAQQIKADYPQVKILMMTFEQEEAQIISALLAGVDGYCLKDGISERLNEVINIVYSGEAWLDPVIARKVMSVLQSRISLPQQERPFKNIGLTERERKILSLIVGGKNNANIAKELSVSYHTIKSDVTHILSKLAVPDRVQAAVKALKENLV
jgi:two-component system, NarL family, response regulator LiaR